MAKKKAVEIKHFKNIPASESGVGITCTSLSGKIYRITQNPLKQEHTLWLCTSDGYDRIASGEDPYVLYPLIDWS